MEESRIDRIHGNPYRGPTGIACINTPWPPEIILGKQHLLTIVPGKTGVEGESAAVEAGTGYF